MITEQDLKEAIAECQGELHPNANTCIKLAAFLTIRNELYGEPDRRIDPAYSLSAGPATDVHTIEYSGVSEFAQAISGREPAQVWPVIDELMGTLQIMNPRLYDAVMGRLR